MKKLAQDQTVSKRMPEKDSNSDLPIVISDLYINVSLLKMAQYFSVSEKSGKPYVKELFSTL